MAEEMMDPAMEQEMAPEQAGEGEEEVVAQIIQLIAGLSPEAQRELMGFLNQEFSSVMEGEQQEMNASPEEQDRKADVMSDAF